MAEEGWRCDQMWIVAQFQREKDGGKASIYRIFLRVQKEIGNFPIDIFFLNLVFRTCFGSKCRWPRDGGGAGRSHQEKGTIAKSHS